MSGTAHVHEVTWQCVNLAGQLSELVQKCGTLPNVETLGLSPLSDLERRLGDPAFEICINGVRDTLLDLVQFFQQHILDESVLLSEESWRDKRIYIYQLDFLLKQRMDQVVHLFLRNQEASSLLEDVEGSELWKNAFGRKITMVPWHVFFQLILGADGEKLRAEEENIKQFLDFTRNDFVSAFEFSVFLKWFGHYDGCWERMLEALHGGLICGFVPALEANKLLTGKKPGTFLIRMSKTKPGSFAVTFMDNHHNVKHCLLYAVQGGVTLRNPPTVYHSLRAFAAAHAGKLKYPLNCKWRELIHIAEQNATGGVETITATGDGTGENEVCLVCWDKAIDTVFLECGHLACCKDCAKSLNPRICPICRAPITRVVNIFRP